MKKLFIWTSDYELFLSFAETKEQAIKNILSEKNITDLIMDRTSAIEDYFDRDVISEILEILSHKPTIIEAETVILSHANA